MKKMILIIILNFILCFSCNSQEKKSTLENFINAYNEKDSIATFHFLHNDFVELFEKDTAIVSKTDYSKNFAWGKVMNDRIQFEIIDVVDGEIEIIETMSTYYSDRDNMLNVKPYKSIRKFFIKDDQIIKIIESKFSGYEDYDNPRRKKYDDFFNWLAQEYELSIVDFKFDGKGAEKLKKYLTEYSKKQ